MMKYLQERVGERSTVIGFVMSLALVIGSFFVPVERGDIADTMRAIAVPLMVGMFLWKDGT